MASTPIFVHVSYNQSTTIVLISAARGITLEALKQSVFANLGFGEGKKLAAVRYRYPISTQPGIVQYGSLNIERDDDVEEMFSIFGERSHITSIELSSTLEDIVRNITHAEDDMPEDPNADIMREIMEEKYDSTPWQYRMYGSVNSEEWLQYNLSPDQNSR